MTITANILPTWEIGDRTKREKQLMIKKKSPSKKPQAITLSSKKNKTKNNK
jgi:hypothetical protein